MKPNAVGAIVAHASYATRPHPARVGDCSTVIAELLFGRRPSVLQAELVFHGVRTGHERIIGAPPTSPFTFRASCPGGCGPG